MADSLEDILPDWVYEDLGKGLAEAVANSENKQRKKHVSFLKDLNEIIE